VRTRHYILWIESQPHIHQIPESRSIRLAATINTKRARFRHNEPLRLPPVRRCPSAPRLPVSYTRLNPAASLPRWSQTKNRRPMSERPRRIASTPAIDMSLKPRELSGGLSKNSFHAKNQSTTGDSTKQREHISLSATAVAAASARRPALVDGDFAAGASCTLKQKIPRLPRRSAAPITTAQHQKQRPANLADYPFFERSNVPSRRSPAIVSGNCFRKAETQRGLPAWRPARAVQVWSGRSLSKISFHAACGRSDIVRRKLGCGLIPRYAFLPLFSRCVKPGGSRRLSGTSRVERHTCPKYPASAPKASSKGRR